MNLDVLIPSLLLPAPILKLFPPPAVPALERMLARADTRVASTPGGGASWLCERWGVGAPYPVAPLLAEYDGFDPSNDGWMFAEPVHLTPDRDRLKLFPARFLELREAETRQLITILNSHFADRNLQFVAPAHASLSQRWYVRCAPAEIPETTPPNAARVGSLADFQPRSRGTLNWRSLQNEAQMLFFGHPVNEAREAAGKPTISGVWFWGGGILPELKRAAYDCVATDSAIAMQLARKSGIPVLPPSWDSIRSAQGNVLAVIDSCAESAGSLDFPAWRHELERLDREWFQPMSRALATGNIQYLSIFAPDVEDTRSFHLTRRNHFLRFWRAAKPLSRYA